MFVKARHFNFLFKIVLNVQEILKIDKEFRNFGHALLRSNSLNTFFIYCLKTYFWDGRFHLTLLIKKRVP